MCTSACQVIVQQLPALFLFDGSEKYSVLFREPWFKLFFFKFDFEIQQNVLAEHGHSPPPYR